MMSDKFTNALIKHTEYNRQLVQLIGLMMSCFLVVFVSDKESYLFRVGTFEFFQTLIPDFFHMGPSS